MVGARVVGSGRSEDPIVACKKSISYIETLSGNVLV